MFHFARFATLLLFIGVIGAFGVANAKEPSSWFVGAGGGYGATNIDRLYSASAKSGGIGVTWAAGTWIDQVDTHYKSWGLAFEALVGYKHFLNDYLGLRYYANVAGQFYKNPIFSNDKTKLGVLDYTINADLLINFYNGESFTLGIFGGFGVGGAHFDSPELGRYENYYGAAKDSTTYTQYEFDGVGEIWRNYVSATINAGVRINIFQSLRGSGHLMCSVNNGRRQCRSASNNYLEHSLEVGAKFPLLTYKPTTDAEVMGKYCSTAMGDNPNLNGAYLCAHMRHSYEIKTPYRFTIRYIIAF